MRTFDVDVFLRRGKQHSAVRWMFGNQMSVLQKKFAYNTFRCRRHFFFTFDNDSFTNSLGTGSIRCLGECRTMYKFTHMNVLIVFACRCKPAIIQNRRNQTGINSGANWRTTWIMVGSELESEDYLGVVAATLDTSSRYSFASSWPEEKIQDRNMWRTKLKKNARKNWG